MTPIIINYINEYNRADIRSADHYNCSRCPKLIDYTYHLVEGEIVCEKCWLKYLESKKPYKDTNNEINS